MGQRRGHVVHFPGPGIVHIVAQSRHGGGDRTAVTALQRLEQSRDVVGNRAAVSALALVMRAAATSTGTRTGSSARTGPGSRAGMCAVIVGA